MSVEKLCGKTLSNAHPKPFKWRIEKEKLEKYPSGRRGSPAKGVGRQKRREGSNPSFSASSE